MTSCTALHVQGQSGPLLQALDGNGLTLLSGILPAINLKESNIPAGFEFTLMAPTDKVTPTGIFFCCQFD